MAATWQAKKALTASDSSRLIETYIILSHIKFGFVMSDLSFRTPIDLFLNRSDRQKRAFS